MAITTEDTSFTHDILGRYVCNTFAEAKNSGTFDIIIIGGGTFGLTLAQDLFERSRPLGARAIRLHRRTGRFVRRPRSRIATPALSADTRSRSATGAPT